MIRVRLLLFALYRDLTGRSDLELELPPGSTVADLVAAVRARGGGWARLPEDPVAAVNREYAAGDRVLQEGDEIAFLPPVAGGSSVHARVTSEPIDAAAVLARVGAPQDGAALLFLGVVRDHNDDLPVTGVRYDAYGEMAEGVLLEIAREAAERLGTDRIAVEHRIGELAVGEASVAIAVSSPHRAESFDACRYVIEEIKKRLPVWKQERYQGGASRWLEGTRPEVPETYSG